MFKGNQLPHAPYSNLTMDLSNNRFLEGNILIKSELVDDISPEIKGDIVVCRPIPIIVTEEKDMFIRTTLPTNCIGIIIWSPQIKDPNGSTKGMDLFPIKSKSGRWGVQLLNEGKNIHECLNAFADIKKREQRYVNVSIGKKDDTIVVDMLLFNTYTTTGGVINLKRVIE